MTLQVLVACMRCPGRDLLTNDNIISIFQACFRIGHYQTERSKDMSGTTSDLAAQITSLPLALTLRPALVDAHNSRQRKEYSQACAVKLDHMLSQRLFI